MRMDLFGKSTPPGWEPTTLGQVVKRGGGSIQTGPFGSQLHAADYVSSGIPSIMPVNIGDNRIIESGIVRITEEDANRLARHRVRAGDIIYSRRGDVERRALIREKEAGWLCGTGCLKVRLGEGVADPLFTAYYLGHPEIRAWIVQHAVGATMPNLNTSIMEAIPFLLPPLPEQKAIAGVLGALDDKVELNRRRNRTLEEMARAIFKSWFVDFDPVKAKAEGRTPPGLSPEIAALFPDKFEFAGNRKIPVDWSVLDLERLVEVKHGFAFSGNHIHDYPSGDILLTPGNFAIGGGFKEAKYKYYDGCVPEGFVLDQHDLLITMTDLSKAADTLGFPSFIPAGPGNKRYLHNQRLGKVIITQPEIVSPFFLYWLFCSDSYRDEILASSTGTTVKHTSPSRIKAFRTALPGQKLMRIFHEISESCYLQASQNLVQSRTLTTLRNTLLPKLISGEMDILEVKRIVGKAI